MINKREVLLGGIGAFAVPAAAGGWAGGAAGSLRIHDLMPAFWQAFRRANAVAPAKRALCLYAAFFQPRAALYAQTGLVDMSELQVGRWLDGRSEQDWAKVERCQTTLVTALQYAQTVYARSVPTFDPAASPVYILPSLGRFDGHVGQEGVSSPLFLAPDTVPAFHPAEDDLRVLTTHELFHCFQAQRRSPDRDRTVSSPLHAVVWREGSATYASERLVPGALPERVLTGTTLLHLAQEQERAAAAAMLERLDSIAEADKVLFLSARDQAAWPGRTAYRFGLDVAREVGASVSVEALAKMSPALTRDALRAYLMRVSR